MVKSVQNALKVLIFKWKNPIVKSALLTLINIKLSKKTNEYYDFIFI